MCMEEQKRTGILASVSLAQFILETGYGRSELARDSNNCFGMKAVLSGNSWPGSVWDGTSVCIKRTKESCGDGTFTEIVAEFRKYGSVEESIADHSAYLIAAKAGSFSDEFRYAGIRECRDYRKAAQIIQDGCYSGSGCYADALCELIRQWRLTFFDEKTDECRLYSDTGEKLMALYGREIRIDADPSVISVTIDGKKMESCGSTMLLMEGGLQPDIDFHDSPAGLIINPVAVVVRSRSGKPVCIFSGDAVNGEVCEGLPDTMKLTIDGRKLYLHRAEFQIMDRELLEP